ncbi:MAG: Uma2 family endonuclease [Planctomycetaceae bacterium]
MTTLNLEPILHSPRLPDIAAVLNERLRDETARRERFYEEMSDDQKVEFIDGEVVMHSPARNRHLTAKLSLATLLNTFVELHGLGAVRDEKCLCVFPRNDYEPDIVFFGPEKANRFHSNTMKFPVPDFVVEVLSDTTERRDRGVKFEDYEAHGVQEYWIIDPKEGRETVEQYVLEEGSFQLRLKSGSGEIVSQVIPNFRIPIRSIFDTKENLAALKTMLG